MIGAIAGDIIGQPYERRPIKTMDFQLLDEALNVYTDDSVMTLAICKAILEVGKNADDDTLSEAMKNAMQGYGRKYRNAGYGGMFANWIVEEDPQPYGSYGNGSAMRVSSIAWIYKENLERALHVAKMSAEITHNHPEGIKGAVATTHCMWMSLNGFEKDEIRKEIEEKYYPLERSCDEIRKIYFFDASCQGTVPVAVQCFLEGSSYEQAVRLAVSMGGDSDTLAAIAGGMAEAYYGVPPYVVGKAMNILPKELRRDVMRFWKYTIYSV